MGRWSPIVNAELEQYGQEEGFDYDTDAVVFEIAEEFYANAPLSTDEDPALVDSEPQDFPF